MQVIPTVSINGQHTAFPKGTAAFASSIRATTHTLLEPAKKLAGAANGFSLGFVPLEILGLGESIKGLVEDPPLKKINASLDIISALKEIGEGIVTFLGYLADLKAIAESSLSWSGPFSLVMTALSISSIARKVKICTDTHGLLQEFDTVISAARTKGKLTQHTLHEIMCWIENKQRADQDFLSEFLNVKEESFAEALVAREREIDEKLSSSKPQECEEGQEQLEKTIKSLRGRIQKNIPSSIISIVSSIVSMVGSILVFCCPVNPLGWSLIGVSGLIDAGRLIYHKVTEYESSKEIGLKRTYFEWICC
jgi:hypothetical protein